MKAKTILLVVAAFLVGAVAAGSIGVRVIREVRTDEDATSLPTTTVTRPPSAVVVTYQVDPTETILGSSALVPTSVEGSATRVAIGYDLVLLAPHARVDGVTTFVPGSGFTDVAVSEITHVWPRTWRLETTGGTFEGGPANPDTRIARFDVDEGFSLSEIVGATIVDARTPFVRAQPFSISESNPRVEVVPGVDVELVNVSDQGSTTIVQIALDIEDHELTSAFVRGDGPGWRSAVLEAEGRPRINLTFVGDALPDPIPLMASVTSWIELPGPFEVDLGEFG